MVEQAMKEGASGLSTGLIYIPGAYAETDEVIGLARAAARHNGLYASHIRNEENKAAEAINEAIHIGKGKISGNALPGGKCPPGRLGRDH